MASPLSRLGMADVPAALVPMRFAATVFTDDPDRVMPFPALPEITLETAPDCARRILADRVPLRRSRNENPVPAIAERRAGAG